jgi:hypothetical protein
MLAQGNIFQVILRLAVRLRFRKIRNHSDPRREVPGGSSFRFVICPRLFKYEFESYSDAPLWFRAGIKLPFSHVLLARTPQGRMAGDCRNRDSFAGGRNIDIDFNCTLNPSHSSKIGVGKRLQALDTRLLIPRAGGKEQKDNREDCA